MNRAPILRFLLQINVYNLNLYNVVEGLSGSEEMPVVKLVKIWSEIQIKRVLKLLKSTCESGPRFIIQNTNELILIAHLHMRIVKIQRVGQSARILPIHVKEEKTSQSEAFSVLL